MSGVWCGKCGRHIRPEDVPAHCTPGHVGAELA